MPRPTDIASKATTESRRKGALAWAALAQKWSGKAAGKRLAGCFSASRFRA
jgi:hypothetical protein